MIYYVRFAAGPRRKEKAVARLMSENRIEEAERSGWTYGGNDIAGSSQKKQRDRLEIGCPSRTFPIQNEVLGIVKKVFLQVCC